MKTAWNTKLIPTVLKAVQENKLLSLTGLNFPAMPDKKGYLCSIFTVTLLSRFLLLLHS